MTPAHRCRQLRDASIVRERRPDNVWCRHHLIREEYWVNKRTESDLVREIIELLNMHRCVAVRFNNQPTMQVSNGVFVGYRRLTNRRGIADIVAVAPNGRSIWIEVKTARGRLSDEQREFLDDVHSHGAIAMVARSVDDVIAMIARQHLLEWNAPSIVNWKKQ